MMSLTAMLAVSPLVILQLESVPPLDSLHGPMKLTALVPVTVPDPSFSALKGTLQWFQAPTVIVPEPPFTQ